MSELRELFTKWNIVMAPPGHKRYNDKWIHTDCPYCMSWGKFHMGFSALWWNANCWKCGKRSSWEAIQLLQPRVTKQELREVFKTRARIMPVRDIEPVGEYSKPPTVPLKRGHHEYLKSRGFNGFEIQKLWGVEGTLSTLPRWKNLPLASRLFIPAIINGEPVSWTTRSIDQNNPQRYISAPRACEAISIKDIAYGVDYPTHTAIIVEGATDAWRIGPGAVSTMGVAFKESQIRLLSRFMRRVVCFDNSVSAQREANRLAIELSSYPGETIVVQIEGEDPATAPQEEIDLLRSTFL